MGGFAPVRPRLRYRILDDPQAPQLDGQFAAPYAPMEPPQEPSAPPVRMGDVFGAGALSGMTGRSAMSSAVPMDRPMTLKERIIAGLGGFAGGAARGALNPPRVFTGRSWEADPYQLQAQRMGGEYGLQAQRLGAEERMMGERLGVESELSKQRLAELIAAQQMRGQTATDVAGIRAGGQIGAAQERAAGTLGAAELRREMSLAEIAARERMNSATNAIRSEANRIRSQGTQGKLAPTEQRMKDISIATLPRVDALIDETQNVSDMLGPLTGRWNDLWTG